MKKALVPLIAFLFSLLLNCADNNPINIGETTSEKIKLLTKAFLCVAIYFGFVASPLFINAIT